MTRVRPDVRAFFLRYEGAAADLDSEALTSCFRDVFMSLDASSATAVSLQALLAALPRRKQLFNAIGSDGLELADISEMPGAVLLGVSAGCGAGEGDVPGMPGQDRVPGRRARAQGGVRRVGW
jgi:hypothetical protein